jgi:hypothetical protein
MRIVVTGLLALATLASPANAAKLPSRTTIVLLTDEIVQRYIACVASVDKAEGGARGAIPGQSYSAARRRDRAAAAARFAARAACGWREDDPWRYVHNAILIAKRGRVAEKLYVNGETTTRGVRRAQAANRRLIAKYPGL